MDFHLKFSIPPCVEKINYSHKILFIGSCFAENIGEIMEEYKFSSMINPHGVLYNPASIAVALDRYICKEAMKEDGLFFANECWNSWEHHSRFSNPDKPECLTEINQKNSEATTFIKEADWLFITFGSAFVYHRNETGELVGNCHKIPQKEFSKRILTIEEIVSNYKILISELVQLNKNLKIVFTVSPVRYIRDGVVENSLSKARLIEAVHELAKQYENVFYFPAFELVTDDLRDYRFYKSDMIHPNEQAIKYVFEKIQETFFDEKTKQVFDKIKDIVLAKKHKPFNPNTNEHNRFKETYFNRCKQLEKEYPHFDLANELGFFSAK